ncbi:MAG: (d)CMP kinase [Planctomycetia bacterium]|nr:(d)CMP kinase [Planctomycetia bacterium]
MIITLDGPAGAGKSSAARALARRLGWCYIDTGAMYRAVALAALERGITLEDSPRVAELAESIRIEFSNGAVLVDGRDVSTEIRTERITLATRPVADAPPVRDAMKKVQRRMAEGIDVVTEGRDQGSVVFPQAELKVFLTASAEERARRRHREEIDRGQSATLEAVLEAQSRRDDADRTRPVGAMLPADDAVVLETDGMSPEQVIDRLVALLEARRRMAGRTAGQS